MIEGRKLTPWAINKNYDNNLGFYHPSKQRMKLRLANKNGANLQKYKTLLQMPFFPPYHHEAPWPHKRT